MLTSWNMVHYTVATSNIHLCRQLLFAKTLLQLFIVLNLVHLGKKWGYTLIPRLCSRLPSLRLWVQTRFFNPRHLFVAYSLKRLNECHTRFNFLKKWSCRKKHYLISGKTCFMSRETKNKHVCYTAEIYPTIFTLAMTWHLKFSWSNIKFHISQTKIMGCCKNDNKRNNWIMGLKSALNFNPGHDLDFFRAHSH